MTSPSSPAARLSALDARLSRPDTIISDTRAPWWRTTLYAVVAASLMLVSWAISRIGWRVQTDQSDVSFLITVLALAVIVGLCVLLFMRHRFPYTLVAASAIVSVFLPIGNVFPLLTLASLLGRRRGPSTTAVCVLVGVTSAIVTVLDATANPIGASLIKTSLSGSRPNDADMAWNPLATLIVYALGLGLALMSGLVVQTSRQSKTATRQAASQRHTTDLLTDEVARHQERERIAREIHDALGHRLSIVTLHAGALEAKLRDNPELAASARLVRESTTAAVDDLHSLLGVLRDPMGTTTDIPLSKLREVLADAGSAGQPMSSAVFIDDADSAPAALSRAVYRIVQEILTNACKHAPGQLLTLQVDGSPGKGITITASNPLAPTSSDSGAGSGQGGSRGLVGVAERAESLGGSAAYGIDRDAGVFRVTVQLPW